MNFTYDVRDVFNIFGGGHAYRLTSYREGRRLRHWDFDSMLPGRLRLARKIRHLETVYGATRVGSGLSGEELEARARWLAVNAAKKAAGCPCGRPATHVTRIGGTLGGIPAESWSCEEHRNVKQWSRSGGDGPWEPSGDYEDCDRAWFR